MWGSTSFIGLNLVDAWLTKQLFTPGQTELNPVVRYLSYGDDLVLKGLLAVAIALILWRFGKSHLLWYLNIVMLIVISWNTAVLTVGNLLLTVL